MLFNEKTYTTKKPLINFLIDNNMSNNNNFYHKCSNDIFVKLEESNLKLEKPNKIIINKKCIIKNIELIDFPKNKYTLKYKNTEMQDIDGKFDLTNLYNQHLTKIEEDYVKYQLQDPQIPHALHTPETHIVDCAQAHGEDCAQAHREYYENTVKAKLEEYLEFEKKHFTEDTNLINSDEYSLLEIYYPPNTLFNAKHQIKIFGYYFINDSWIEKTEIFYYYHYNTYLLQLDGTVDSLILTTKIKNKDLDAKFSVLIDNEEYNYTFSKDNNNKKKIKLNFFSTNNRFISSQNTFLPEEKKNIVNFSRVGYASIVLFNCENIEIIKRNYKIYKYFDGKNHPYYY